MTMVHSLQPAQLGNTSLTLFTTLAVALESSSALAAAMPLAPATRKRRRYNTCVGRVNVCVVMAGWLTCCANRAVNPVEASDHRVQRLLGQLRRVAAEDADWSGRDSYLQGCILALRAAVLAQPPSAPVCLTIAKEVADPALQPNTHCMFMWLTVCRPGPVLPTAAANHLWC